jgi:hypothetical protein
MRRSRPSGFREARPRPDAPAVTGHQPPCGRSHLHSRHTPPSRAQWSRSHASPPRRTSVAPGLADPSTNVVEHAVAATTRSVSASADEIRLRILVIADVLPIVRPAPDVTGCAIRSPGHRITRSSSRESGKIGADSRWLRPGNARPRTEDASPRDSENIAGGRGGTTTHGSSARRRRGSQGWQRARSSGQAARTCQPEVRMARARPGHATPRTTARRRSYARSSASAARCSRVSSTMC